MSTKLSCHTCLHRELKSSRMPCRACLGQVGYAEWEPQSAPTETPKDEHHDSHYVCQEIQPIEYLQAALSHEEFTGFCRGNIIKYASRLGRKDAPQKELDKIMEYKQFLKQHLAGEKVQPRRTTKEEK